jgi:hypothetical protein
MGRQQHWMPMGCAVPITIASVVAAIAGVFAVRDCSDAADHARATQEYEEAAAEARARDWQRRFQDHLAAMKPRTLGEAIHLMGREPDGCGQFKWWQPYTATWRPEESSLHSVSISVESCQLTAKVLR